MRRFAADCAKQVKGGQILALEGPLGAGKTFFIRNTAEALGVTEPVTSPSFTMAQTYGGTTTVHHLDLYRLPKFDSSDAIDFEPFFEAEAITFIEWPEQAVPFLEEPAVVVRMEHVDINSRRISIQSSRKELIRGMEKAIADLVD